MIQNVLNLNQDGAILYTGQLIPPIAVMGNGGVKFASDITAADPNGIGYYYFSDNLPRGLKITQPTIEFPYGRITGSFQSISSGQFIVSVQDSEGTIAQCRVQYNVTKIPLQFKKFSHFDYYPNLTVNKAVPRKDFSVGVYGGTPPYRFYFPPIETVNNVKYGTTSLNDTNWNLTIDSQTGIIEPSYIGEGANRILSSGFPKQKSDQLSFQIVVIDNDQQEASIEISTGPVYDLLMITPSEEIVLPTAKLHDVVGPLYLNVSGGKPFEGKIKYRITAKNVPKGIKVTYGSYTYNNTSYNCCISGTYEVEPATAVPMEIRATDARENIVSKNISFATVNSRLTFTPNVSTDLIGNNGDNYTYSVSIDLKELVNAVGTPTVSIVRRHNGAWETVDDQDDEYGLKAFLNLVWSYFANEESLEFIRTTGVFTEHTLTLVDPYETGFTLINYEPAGEIPMPETLVFNADGSSGNNLVIQQVEADYIKLANAKALGQLYLCITALNETVYYPISIGDIYPPLQWIVGFEKSETSTEETAIYNEIETIYIDPNELKFTLEEEEVGKFVKIFLVKQQLLKEDPIAKKILDKIVPGENQIYRFRKWVETATKPDNTYYSVLKDHITVEERSLWYAWALKNLDLLQLTAGQVDSIGRSGIQKYLYDFYMSCGYIYGGKPPYTISLSVGDFGSFKVVQNEDGRELLPEEIHLSGKMNIGDKTPGDSCAISLTDSLGNKITKQFSYAQQVVESPKIVFINSLEEYELISGHTNFSGYGWPFLRAVNINGLECRWKKVDNNNAPIMADANDAKFKLRINKITEGAVTYFTLGRIDSIINPSLFELTTQEIEELTNCQDFRTQIQLWKNNTIFSDIPISGSFKIPNIVNFETVVHQSDLIIPEATWGSNFKYFLKTVNVDGEDTFETVINPVFSQNPPLSCKYQSAKATEEENEKSSIALGWGLYLDSATGKVSGTFTNSTNQAYIKEKTDQIEIKAIVEKNELTPTIAPSHGACKIIVESMSWPAPTIKIELLYNKMEYIEENQDYHKMIVPHVDLHNFGNWPNWDLKNKLPSQEADPETNPSDRIRGGVVDGANYTWTLVKAPKISVKTSLGNYGREIIVDYNLFQLDSASGVLTINSSELNSLGDQVLSQVPAIEPMEIIFKVEDNAQHSIRKSIVFFGAQYYATSPTFSICPIQLKEKNSGEMRPVEKFTCDRNIVGSNFKAFAITLANRGQLSSSIFDNNIRLFDFVNGYSSKRNLEVDFVEVVNNQERITAGKGVYTLTKETGILGGIALKESKNPQGEIINFSDQVKITDQQIKAEQDIGYLESDCNTSVTFTIDYQKIFPKFSWKYSSYGISDLDESLDSLINGQGLYFYFVLEDYQTKENEALGWQIQSVVTPQGNSNEPAIVLQHKTINSAHTYCLQIQRENGQNPKLVWQGEPPTTPVIVTVAANYFARTENKYWKDKPIHDETQTIDIILNAKNFYFYNWWINENEKPSIENPIDTNHTNQAPAEVVSMIPDGEIVRTSYDGYIYDYTDYITWGERTSWKSKTITINELICYSKCIIDISKLLPFGAGIPPYSYSWSNTNAEQFNKYDINCQVELSITRKLLTISIGGEICNKKLGRKFQLYDAKGNQLNLTINIQRIIVPFQRKLTFAQDDFKINGQAFTAVNKGMLTYHTAKDSNASIDVATELFFFGDCEVRKRKNGSIPDFWSGSNLQSQSYTNARNKIAEAFYFILDWTKLFETSIGINNISCVVTVPKFAHNIFTVNSAVCIYTIDQTDNISSLIDSGGWRDDISDGTIMHRTSQDELEFTTTKKFIVLPVSGAYRETHNTESYQQPFGIDSSADGVLPYITLSFHRYGTSSDLIPQYNYYTMDLPIVFRKNVEVPGSGLTKLNDTCVKFDRLPYNITKAGTCYGYAAFDNHAPDSSFDDDFLFYAFGSFEKAPNILTPVKLQMPCPMLPTTLTGAIRTNAKTKLMNLLGVPKSSTQSNTYKLKIDIPLGWKLPTIYKNKAGNIVKYQIEDTNARGLFKVQNSNNEFIATTDYESLSNLQSRELFLMSKPDASLIETNKFTLMKTTVWQKDSNHNETIISQGYVWISPVSNSELSMIPKAWYTYYYNKAPSEDNYSGTTIIESE